MERIHASDFAEGRQEASDARMFYETFPDSARQATRALQYVAFFDWKLGRYEPAEEHARRCIEETRAQSLAPFILALRLNLLGFVLSDRGRPREAVGLYEEALAISEREHGPLHTSVAAGWNNVAAAQLAGGDLVAARLAYERALGIYRKLQGPEHEDVARGLANLALAHAALAEWSTAASLLREALAMRTRLLPPDDPLLDKTMLNLAGVLSDRGDWTDAEPYAREALRRRRQRLGPDHPDVANTLTTLAKIRQGQGDLASAEILLREALALRRRTLREGHPRIALALRKLASVRAEQGQAAEAEPLLLEALAIQRNEQGSDHPRLPGTLAELASVWADRGAFASAESLLTEALVIRRRVFPDGGLPIALSLVNLAALQRRQGNRTDAERLLREALAIRRESYEPDHPAVADVAARLARVLTELDQFTEAEELALFARDAHVRARGPSHPSVGRDLEILATVHEARAQWGDAATLLEDACRIFERSRRRAGSGVERATFRSSPYPRLAAVLLELGRGDEAWIATERSRARALQDLRKRFGSESLERSRLASDLRELEQRIAILQDASVDGDTRPAVRELAVRRDRAEAAWAELLAREPVTLSEEEHLSPRAIGSTLPTDTILAGWLDAELAGGRAVAWVWTLGVDGRPRWARIDADPTAPRALRAVLEEAASWPWRVTELGLVERRARSVWDVRLEAAAAPLRSADHLVIVPSGPMVGIPVEALVSPDGTMALDRWTIRYLPGASLTSDRRPAPAGRRVGFLAVGAPEPLPEGWPPLPGARAELEEFARRHPSAEVLVGAEATENALDRVAAANPDGFAELHFATHARLDAHRPERSALVLRAPGPAATEAALAGLPVRDGYLTAAEIARDWRIPADLVSLGGCATLGTAAAGESWLGLAHAFLQVGATSVLASHWSVDDAAAALLLAGFREHSATGDRAVALSRAKRELRDLREEGGQPWAHPAYWAGFVLVGDAQ